MHLDDASIRFRFDARFAVFAGFPRPNHAADQHCSVLTGAHRLFVCRPGGDGQNALLQALCSQARWRHWLQHICRARVVVSSRRMY